jgi:hypothetical protein
MLTVDSFDLVDKAGAGRPRAAKEVSCDATP